MNVKRGFVRAVISIVLMWSAFWSWTYYDANGQAANILKTLIFLGDAKAKDPTTGDPNSPSYSLANVKFAEDEIAELRKLRDDQEDRSFRAFEMIWQGIVAIFLSAAAAAWTYSGLRQDGDKK